MTEKRKYRAWAVAFAVLSLVWGALPSEAPAFTVKVVDQNGNAIVGGFKWLLEQDNTHDPAPGVHKPVDVADVNNNTLSIGIHRSHAPVVASGVSDTSTTAIDTLTLPGGTVPVAPGRYFVSVLPHGDRSTCSGTYDMGGSPVTVATNAETVTVKVRQAPIETAQISVKVFHDINPLNNAPDVGDPGLAGFTITLTEQAGDIVQDAFGNKLGTTYVVDPNTGKPILDPTTCSPTVLTEGIGDFVTPANGEVIIKNLLPGKYGVEVEPPTTDASGNPVKWHQTTTIEGTKTIDAWVRPNEPPFLVEFGPPFWHTFYGFVKEMDLLNTLPGAIRATVTGTVRKGHLSRPPAITFFNGPPPEGEGIGERCLIGLNTLEQGAARAVWVGLCADGTGDFTIPNVPPGTYQIVIWDVQLLHIISFNTVIVNANGSCGTPTGTCNLGNLFTPMWFGQQEHYVYLDLDGNGIRNRDADGNPTEPGIPEQNINLRFRDGTIYKAFPTDTSGFVPFQAIFPFFHWQVAEVDFLRFKATGVTVTNDDGGPVTDDADGEGRRNPVKTTETGPVLTRAYQVFAGQNQRYEWGKMPYPAGENGGISGIVFYATTRAEDDPRFAAGDPWEPGIPRVQVNLYKDVTCNSTGGPAIYAPGSPFHCPQAIPGEVGDGIPDEVNGEAGFQPADVDNHPLGWANGGAKGPEDIDHNNNGLFDQGDALRVTWTDSWDDSLPEGCSSPTAVPLNIHGTAVPLSQCAEGLRTWNQARPGVFDGGYAFGPHVTGDPEEPELAPGTYIVEAVPPPGYKIVKEEDRNVDFGPTPIPAILPARCVGPDHTVPLLFSFLTKDGSGDPAQALPGVDITDEGNWAPFNGAIRQLCSRKRVDLGTGQNAATDFHMFTDVPKAARAVGLITDDFANELAPGKPSFTEKFSPPWITVAVFDYTGKEILRTAGDEFGAYNFLAPSTYLINAPIPSGIGPKMHHFCLNHPGPVPNPDYSGDPGADNDPEEDPEFITDPRFRPQYSTTCYTFNFEAGRTTYLDTPVIRTAAFVGALQRTLDCELPNGTPVIRDVRNVGGPNANMPAFVQGAGDQFVIRSIGAVPVPNPAYPGGTFGNPTDPPLVDEFVTRNYRFGNQQGTVCVGTYCFPSSAVNWGPNRIVVTVPTPLPAGLATGQLVVTKPAATGGQSSLTGVTLTVAATEPATMAVHRVGPNRPFTTIQAAIDAADADDLILVDPGVYTELPIVYKRVRIQGAGAWSTFIDAKHFSASPPNPVEAWRQKLGSLVNAGVIGLLPEQDPNQPDFFFKDGEAPGFFVSPLPGTFVGGRAARIDGLTVRGADLGGAIYVNAYADNLQLSNLRLINNSGNLAGGIRIGNPERVAFARGGVAVETSPNPGLQIHHNHILQNGSFRTGGGISIFKGATNYSIEQNNFCGNLARSGGGAIAHRGLSDGGTIARNAILFNEVFQGDQPGTGLGIGGGGGGIEIAGEPDAAGGPTAGTGDVTINRNLIQGNLAGTLDGGGIALSFVNGQDIANSDNPADWYRINIYNNMIVNNVAALAGGAVSLQDTVRPFIIHNTIAHNDSTATAAAAFATGPANPSTPLPAGIVSRGHTDALVAVRGTLPGLVQLTVGDFSLNPASQIALVARLHKNIIYGNRSFFWSAATAPVLQPAPTGGGFSNLGVVGGPAGATLNGAIPLINMNFLENSTAPSSLFNAAYPNELTTASAADEGGNFVQVYYTPLGLTGDYHLQAPPPANPALNPPLLFCVGCGAELGVDFDGQARPNALLNRGDYGADELP